MVASAFGIEELVEKDTTEDVAAARASAQIMAMLTVADTLNVLADEALKGIAEVVDHHFNDISTSSFSPSLDFTDGNVIAKVVGEDVLARVMGVADVAAVVMIDTILSIEGTAGDILKVTDQTNAVLVKLTDLTDATTGFTVASVLAANAAVTSNLLVNSVYDSFVVKGFDLDGVVKTTELLVSTDEIQKAAEDTTKLVEARAEVRKAKNSGAMDIVLKELGNEVVRLLDATSVFDFTDLATQASVAVGDNDALEAFKKAHIYKVGITIDISTGKVHLLGSDTFDIKGTPQQIVFKFKSNDGIKDIFGSSDGDTSPTEEGGGPYYVDFINYQATSATLSTYSHAIDFENQKKTLIFTWQGTLTNIENTLDSVTYGGNEFPISFV
jgi:hypothetical protein